jgi:hypothetical protein
MPQASGETLRLERPRGRSGMGCPEFVAGLISKVAAAEAIPPGTVSL